MSTPKKSEKAKTKEESASPEVMLKVRILKSGTILNHAKCAKGLVTRTSKSTAEALQEQGLVQIVGA
jgi:hypothetical protein